MKKLLYSFLIILMACQPQTEQIVYSDSELEKKTAQILFWKKFVREIFLFSQKRWKL